jgi:hypothetical protein
MHIGTICTGRSLVPCVAHIVPPTIPQAAHSVVGPGCVSCPGSSFAGPYLSASQIATTPIVAIFRAKVGLLELAKQLRNVSQACKMMGCSDSFTEYELYLAVEDIDHSRTKTKSPQTNGRAIRRMVE